MKWDKEQGYQHEVVRANRTHPISETRNVNRVGSQPVNPSGSFTWVSPTRPKLTCKCCGQPPCNGCHLRPSWKAKDKTKGTRKLKSNDTVLVYKDLLSGFSATAILDLFDRDYQIKYSIYDTCEKDQQEEEEEEVDCDYDI